MLLCSSKHNLGRQVCLSGLQLPSELLQSVLLQGANNEAWGLPWDPSIWNFVTMFNVCLNVTKQIYIATT